MNVKVSTKQILIRLFNSYVKKHYVKIFISVFCMVLHGIGLSFVYGIAINWPLDRAILFLISWVIAFEDG